MYNIFQIPKGANDETMADDGTSFVLWLFYICESERNY